MNVIPKAILELPNFRAEEYNDKLSLALLLLDMLSCLSIEQIFEQIERNNELISNFVRRRMTNNIVNDNQIRIIKSKLTYMTKLSPLKIPSANMIADRIIISLLVTSMSSTRPLFVSSGGTVYKRDETWVLF